MAKAGLLFIGTEDGMVLFSNPGAIGRWLRVGHELRGKSIQAVWVRPDNPLIVVASCGEEGLWRSADGGQGWERIVETLPAQGEALPQLVALAGKEPVILVAGAGTILRSADDGASFTPGTPDSAWSGAVTVVAAAAYHIDTAFAGTQGGQLFMTADRGRSWQLLKDGLPPIRSIAAARLV